VQAQCGGDLVDLAGTGKKTGVGGLARAGDGSNYVCTGGCRQLAQFVEVFPLALGGQVDVYQDGAFARFWAVE